MTTRTYFPGANTPRGFLGRFSDIVPAWEAPHYTYILKGGPGVGKNTLMKRVACTARANGLSVEEFRCASDPESLDAVRIPERRVVLLDGTAPHSTDPAFPGAEAEILNLGHFLHRETLVRQRGEIERLFAENRAHYATAYACLEASAALRSGAMRAAERVADLPMIREFLRESFRFAPTGDTPRTLFLSSATPAGVVSFAETHAFESAVYLPGIVGALMLREAMCMSAASRAEIFLDFRTPETAEGVVFPDGTALLLSDDPSDTLHDFLHAPLPDFIPFALREAELLVAHSVEELRQCLKIHDEIERLYRPFVDYARVDHETDRLLEQLAL